MDIAPLIPFITRVGSPTYDSWDEAPSRNHLILSKHRRNIGPTGPLLMARHELARLIWLVWNIPWGPVGMISQFLWDPNWEFPNSWDQLGWFPHFFGPAIVHFFFSFSLGFDHHPNRRNHLWLKTTNQQSSLVQAESLKIGFSCFLTGPRVSGGYIERVGWGYQLQKRQLQTAGSPLCTKQSFFFSLRVK